MVDHGAQFERILLNHVPVAVRMVPSAAVADKGLTLGVLPRLDEPPVVQVVAEIRDKVPFPV